MNLERRAYTEDLWSFETDLLGYSDIAEIPHREGMAFLLAPGNFKLILWPRGSFKSTIVTQGYSLWRLVRDPNLRVLIDSRTIDRSKFFLSEIKQQLERNDRFKELFGDWKNIPGWSEHEIILPHRTIPHREPSIRCSGLNSPVTGGHYDLIIMDDLHDETNSQTEVQTDKALMHFQTMFPILEPNGQMIVIGTRWSNLDIYGHIIDSYKCKHY